MQVKEIWRARGHDGRVSQHEKFATSSKIFELNDIVAVLNLFLEVLLAELAGSWLDALLDDVVYDTWYRR